MLNISDNYVHRKLDLSKFSSFKKLDLYKGNSRFRTILLVLCGTGFILLLLPWTQSVQGKGKLTTFRPEHRPQTIHSTLAGRIEKWYVREGQTVRKGDTIVFLSEIKTDYFDPNLVPRTAQQVDAKQSSIESYDSKAVALQGQIEAMKQELKLKTEQLKNKIEQEKLKIQSAKADFEAEKVDYDIAQKQYNRTKELYEKGIKAVTDVEDKRMKMQETQAKLISAENKYRTAENELQNAMIQIGTVKNEYEGKIAKAESDRFSTLSDKFDAQGSVSKLQIQLESYKRRNQFYYITAPQDCYITKVVTPGIGETVKEGDEIVTILPKNYSLAVEMFIAPVDLPLMHLNAPVRFIFDGWPAFVFSGWPNQSFGTYSGKVVAIDNMVSSNGQYRILVVPDSTQATWPSLLRPGSGAQGLALLNDVPVWYEIWRRLNGFPPTFYEAEEAKKEKKDK